MPAYDLTTKAIILLDVLWLFQQLVDHRVIRITFQKTVMIRTN